MNNKIKEKLPNILIILELIFVVFLIIFFSQNNSLLYDDLVECGFDFQEKIFNSLLPNIAVSGGGYVSLFLTKFITFGIPFTLNIHPEDFLTNVTPVIKGIIFAIFFFVSIKYCFLRNKNKWVFLTSLLFISFYTLYLLQISNYLCINLNETFFQYLFCTIFYYILFSYIYKNIIYPNSKYSIKEILLIIFSIIVTATGLETILFPFCLFFFLICGYNVLINLIFYFNKSKLHKKFYKYSLNLKFIAPVIFFYIISFIYLKSPRFAVNFQWRGFGDFDFSLNNTIEFFNLFYHKYIIDNILYWILLILLIILYLKINKIYLQKKKLICILFMIFSIVSIYISLILFGKNDYDSNYWINDFKILVFFKITILAPIFILSDEILKHLKYKYKNLFLKIFCCFLFVISLYYAIQLYNNRYFKYSGYIFKKINYINEKMFMYFYLKNETPHLIKINPLPQDNGWIPLLFLEIIEKNPDKINEKEICSYNITKTSVYIERVYNINLNNPIDDTNAKFCVSDNALDKFFDLGGVISRKELNNINFSKLKNQDYILNNKIPLEDKMSKKEIIDIFRTFY